MSVELGLFPQRTHQWVTGPTRAPSSRTFVSESDVPRKGSEISIEKRSGWGRVPQYLDEAKMSTPSAPEVVSVSIGRHPSKVKGRGSRGTSGVAGKGGMEEDEGSVRFTRVVWIDGFTEPDKRGETGVTGRIDTGTGSSRSSLQYNGCSSGLGGRVLW